jgi:glutaredoxin
MAKDYLKENKVKFDDIDVSKNPSAANEIVEKSGQMGVPVIIIDEKVVIVGFDREALKKALKLKK